MTSHDDPVLELARRAMGAWSDRDTGLPNVRQFLRDLERELARARRRRESLVVLALEPDAEDADIAALARALEAAVRREDDVVRLGERRFGVLLVSTVPYAGRLVAARLAEAAAPYGTLSVGLRPEAPSEADPTRAREVLAEAVRALEEARSCGGDLVVAHEDVVEAPN